MTKQVRQLDRVVIRFAGDSGDGMQLTGDRFTAETAQLGNDISTLPNFPAEIRAPAGTLPGVSSFQVHFADFDILTPGDAPNVLVAMNPAALKANVPELAPGAEIIVNTVFDSIVDSLKEGEKIELRGFGSFRIRRRGARTGRNPKTGEKVSVPPKRIPYFKPGKELRELLNDEC